MSRFYKFCSDALVQMRDGAWVLSNPRVRTHLELDEKALSVIFRYGSGDSETNWKHALTNTSGWDRTEWSYGESGLHTDHTGFSGKRGACVSGEVLFKLLLERFALVEEGSKAYEKFIAPQTSLMDFKRMGTFHQRVGQYVILKKRLKERWRWWHDQKFTEDGSTVRDGPYKFIQEAFVTTYFDSRRVKGKKILDFGGGNGFYAAKFASLGAEVTLVDTSGELIALGEKNHPGKVRFIHAKDSDDCLTILEEIEPGSFDMVFMQDIFLLLLKPEDGKNPVRVPELFQKLFDLLTRKGHLHLMEPNPIFWLAGRYGNKNTPYAIVTEHQNPIFNVAPILGNILEVMNDAGFGLVEYEHPPHVNTAQAENGTVFYANEYAIWDFMTFKKMER